MVRSILLLQLALRSSGLAARRVVLLDQLLNLGGRSADELVDSGRVAVLEDVERRHGLDIVLGRQLGKVVDVDLDEVDVGVLIGPSGRSGACGLINDLLWGKRTICREDGRSAGETSRR